MAQLGEIITLQFGKYANWTGAHFWNFQVRPRVTLLPPSLWKHLFHFFLFSDKRRRSLS
jgi:hypothetical protein